MLVLILLLPSLDKCVVEVGWSLSSILRIPSRQSLNCTRFLPSISVFVALLVKSALAFKCTKSIMKQQFIINHTIHQTQMPALLDNWVINTSSFKMLCPHTHTHTHTHKILFVYFHKNIMLKCWSIKDLSIFLLAPVKLCIVGLQEIAVSCAKCCTVNSIIQLFILVFRKVDCISGVRIFNSIQLNLTNLWIEKTQIRVRLRTRFFFYSVDEFF